MNRTVSIKRISVIVSLDIIGWEKVGDGFDFEDVKGNGGKRHFEKWEEVRKFYFEVKKIR